MSKPTEVTRVTFKELFQIIVEKHTPEKPITLHYIRETPPDSEYPEEANYVVEIREFDTSNGESIKDFIDRASEKEGGFVVYINSDVTTGYQLIDEETGKPF